MRGVIKAETHDGQGKGGVANAGHTVPMINRSR